MDGAFTKPCTVRPRFLRNTPILHNIQLSSSGQNNTVTSEIVTNP